MSAAVPGGTTGRGSGTAGYGAGHVEELTGQFEISEIFPFLGIPKLSQLIEFLSPHAWLLRENTSHTAIPLYPGLYHSEPQPPKGGYDFRGCLIRPTPSHRCPRHPLTPPSLFGGGTASSVVFVVCVPSLSVVQPLDC